MAKFTCPFCIREYDLKEVLYVCPDCGKPSERSFFEKEPVKCKNQVEDPDGGNKHPCGGLATKRVCKYCGQSIPKTALESPNLPFSIVGVSNSGKTNYITVMLEELAHSSGLRLALGHQTSETYTHQEENRKQIYEEHRFPESTNSQDVTPSIWYIRNLQKKHGNICPTYTFTIFDGAGESHENLEPDSIECRYINASKAILLIVDPLILPGVTRKGGVDIDDVNNSLAGDRLANASSTAVINNVANYIKSARGIKSNRMLDIPVAVVLSKFDVIINHRAFGSQALIKNSSLTVRNGMVDLAEIKQVDSEIRNWLEQIGEIAFIDALDSHFKEYYFFGVSSYGAPPKDGSIPDEINPHRVLDPILWLFKRAKFID